MENGTSDSDSTDVESLSGDDNDATDEAQSEKSRKKRGIHWCAVDDDKPTTAPKITWPPSSPSSNWRQLRPVRVGNPLYGTKMQLYSKTKLHLAIYPDGVVKGTSDDNDLHSAIMEEIPNWHGDTMYLRSERGYNLTIRSNGDVLGVREDDLDSRLERSSAGVESCVRIRGLESQLYLCFDRNGTLYGEVNPEEEATVFIEDFQGSYSAFKSKVFPDWYIGITKCGNAKNGKKTAWGQKAIKFLPRRRKFSI